MVLTHHDRKPLITFTREEVAVLRRKQRQRRVERGLPPDPPTPFIDDELAAALVADALKAKPFLAQYAKLLNAGHVARPDLKPFTATIEKAGMLRLAIDDNARSVGYIVYRLLTSIDKIAADADAERIGRAFYYFLKSLEIVAAKFNHKGGNLDGYEEAKQIYNEIKELI